MKREEQIMQAAKELWLVEDNISDVTTFQKGAQWADSHPNWHKFPQETPQNETPYLVTTVDNYVIPLMFYNGIWIRAIDGVVFDNRKIVAFLEFPKPYEKDSLL